MKPDFDISQCKDVAFARNLIKQMDEDYGRHNSAVDFRARLDLPRPIFYRRQSQARVIGLFGDHAIRSRWQDCQLGDVVQDVDMDQDWAVRWAVRGDRFCERLLYPTVRDCSGEAITVEARPTRWMFERVLVDWGAREGQTAGYVQYWKRIE